MKPLILIVILLIFSNITIAQTEAKTELKLSSGQLYSKGENVYLNGKRLKHKKIKSLYQDYPEALSQYRSAKTVQGINFVVAFAGGACIGWELGTYLAAGYIDGVPLAVGTGLIATSIVLQIVTNNKIKKSVELYNGTKTTVLHFEYGILGSGVGVCMKFD